MEPDRHAMVEVRACDGPLLYRLRIEDREMARVALLIEDVRHHESFAFRGVRCLRNKDWLRDGEVRSGVVDIHFASHMIESRDTAMKNVAGTGTADARDIEIGRASCRE